MRNLVVMQSKELALKIENSSGRSRRNIWLNGAIGSAWIYVNASSLGWLGIAIEQTSTFNLILLSGVAIGLAGWLIWQQLQQKTSFMVAAQPVARSLPLILMFGSALSSIGLRWSIEIEAIEVICFAIGTYGLIGLWLPESTWRKGLSIAVLSSFILPFVLQFGVGLGFPVRVLTANIVEHLLEGWQIAAISSHDIIVLENGIAHIDLPCSGLKSLWTGTFFLLGATWIEGRKLNMRWMLICLVSLFLLIAANVSRVSLLVILTYVMHQPRLGEMLHLPLGVIGFMSACGLTWAMLQTVPKLGLVKSSPKSEIDRPISLAHQAILIFSILLLTLIPRPNLTAISPISPSTILAEAAKAQIQLQSIPMTSIESEFFADRKDTLAQKERFNFGNLSGSLLIVSSTSWRSHHAPELCFAGNGFKVDTMQQRFISSQPTRWLSLQSGQMSATYWFQSQHQTTDDFLDRFWSGITRQQSSWVMVSILFNQSKSPDDLEVRTLVSTIHTNIDRAINQAISHNSGANT